jgi:tetratricopeptide (TPR) repeat protein
LHRALDIEVALRGKDNTTKISKIFGHMAVIHQYCGNIELALKYFQHALSIEQRLLPSEHVYIALRFEDIGLCYALQNEHNLALEYYEKALSIVKRTLPVHHKLYRKILTGVMDALYDLGNYRQALEFALSILDDDSTEYKGWTMARISELYLKLNDSSKAYQYFQDASAFHKENQSSHSRIIPKLKNKLEELEQLFLSSNDNKRNA